MIVTLRIALTDCWNPLLKLCCSHLPSSRDWC